ncbi:hypothetical protein [Streptomyces sp. NPDC059631]|uniref:hypothetical protein n=1 Tax=unclassified Streptomyces TaxID=2593676 RepID=UPI00369820FC
MTFPTTPLGLRGELLLGDTWQDITADLYTRDAITHKRGRPYKSAAADPAVVSATIRNLDGKYTPRNAEGPYYGLIGRNTPFRITLPGGPRYLDLTGAADLATTPDAAALDLTGDLDIRWEGEVDWAAAGPYMLLGKWGGAGDRSYHLRVEGGRLALGLSLDGTTGGGPDWALPTTLPRRAAVRVSVSVDSTASTYTGRAYWAESIKGPWIQFGGDSLGTGTFVIFNSGAPLSVAPAQSVTGRCYRAEVRAGAAGTLVAAPDFTARPLGTGGTFTDSAGRVWTLAAGAEVSDRVVRCEGEVPEWPPKWTPSAKDAWTSITATGILRRLMAGPRPLASTLRRRVPSGDPLVYWPLEDGASATQAASPIEGSRPLAVTGLEFAADTSMPGSDALPTLTEAASISGAVPGATAGGWHVEMVYKLSKLPATEQTMLTVQLRPGTGGVAQVVARVSAAGVRVQGLDVDGGVVANYLFTDPAWITQFAGLWNRMQFFSYASSGVTYLVVSWRDVVTSRWAYASASYTGTPGAITGVRGSWGADFQGMTIGHLAAWDVGGTGPNAPGITIYEGCDDGFLRERAATRMQRLSAEEGVPLRILGDPADTARMGSQRPAPLLDLLRECAEADGGILAESSDRRELLYRTRTSLYNQTPALILDYAAGQIAEPFEPVEDDQVRNLWEVQREGGSSGTAELTEGALSTQAPPLGIGLVADSATLNLSSDSQTEPMAHWLLHLSTWDEARYPSVTILLHRCPELIPAVLDLAEGDLVRIINLPRQFTGSGTVDLLLDSSSETLLPRAWTLTLNCEPAGPWKLGEVAVYEDFEDADYAVTITPGGAAPWARSQVHYNGGGWSLKSGTISNNQTSDAVVAVPPGATTCTFWYYVSSEESGPGFEGDRLLVLVDGVQVLRAQGVTGWQQATINVTGATAITFRYAKDNSGGSGEDAAWIDDLLFAKGAPARADTDGSELAAAVTATATTLSVKVTAGPPWITSAAFEGEFPFDVMCGGERMTVTAITGTTSPQQFTVVRSVNGVRKAQTAGTPVRLADPATIAL